MRYGWEKLHAEFAMTQETYFRPGEHIERFHRLGKNVGLALYDAISH